MTSPICPSHPFSVWKNKYIMNLIFNKIHQIHNNNNNNNIIILDNGETEKRKFKDWENGDLMCYYGHFGLLKDKIIFNQTSLLKKSIIISFFSIELICSSTLIESTIFSFLYSNYQKLFCNSNLLRCAIKSGNSIIIQTLLDQITPCILQVDSGILEYSFQLPSSPQIIQLVYEHMWKGKLTNNINRESIGIYAIKSGCYRLIKLAQNLLPINISSLLKSNLKFSNQQGITLFVQFLKSSSPIKYITSILSNIFNFEIDKEIQEKSFQIISSIIKTTPLVNHNLFVVSFSFILNNQLIISEKQENHSILGQDNGNKEIQTLELINLWQAGWISIYIRRASFGQEEEEEDDIFNQDDPSQVRISNKGFLIAFKNQKKDNNMIQFIYKHRPFLLPSFHSDKDSRSFLLM
ncbi:hypothetical protein DFA_02187 [Cavenderia fasciculata]|uniref:Uncharacterized protein n=1 Tax=Cavenderia fasciculata TaxID=261658 RepID=F4PYD3_CACFS|nr:uncharacterized protein DFA_02187 [Cavenderia fasciculata]EGG19400.1 hypothetical protein DFA_02187 [Cavenderia fasciculata]|eukprot:XP_004357671.1 hypothetical protein DFA_02187 [Cavenderia fasciculata]